MVQSVQPVSTSALEIQQILVQAVSQILQHSTDVALLNLSTQTGGNPEGIGELIDLLA